ncbi:lipopolysaccharide biosynthesis protein [Confluentibacter citreus]|uniref:lipopolysaccharide biosynthesis protein n=1 Tax=Confluentibacter citreus TaxID=2007307 RepID=UPI000C285288|nr:sugar transporter [Confluentibacter citreus]
MSRVSKSIKNAKVGVFFFLISIVVQFFSRKIFLDHLGDEFIGLETTIRSILGFLNLAELGIGTAIGFALYKPIFDEDQNEINKIIALLGFLYKRIGFILIGVGLITSLFFPLIFNDAPFSLLLIYFIFYALLSSSLLSYFVNYHLSLLGADQKGYIIQSYFQIFNTTRVIIQCFVAIYLQNFYLWIALELVFSVIYSITLRIKVKEHYPWLIINSSQNAAIIKEYPELIKKIKQVFIHKISVFIKGGTDNILVYALVSLQSVAYFGNYQLIFIKLGGLVKMTFAGTGSAIGNLVAENDKENINKIFWELIAVQFFIAGFFSIIIYYVMGPFIQLWLGAEYIMANSVLLLMIANFFILEISSPIERYKNAYGLYSDTWAPATEAIINLTISFFFGRIWGIEGILLGTLVSAILIVIIWKPYFLYKNGFKKNVWHYWKGIIPVIIIFSISALLISYIISHFPYDKSSSNLINWTIYSFKVTSIVTLVYGVLLFTFIKGFKVFCLRMKKLILSKLFKKK